MKNQIPCEVIQDLFPSYIDGLTRDVTNAEIKGHVEKCDSCRQVLAAMKNPDTEPVDYENKREIDFLKKSNDWKYSGCIFCGGSCAFCKNVSGWKLC